MKAMNAPLDTVAGRCSVPATRWLGVEPSRRITEEVTP